MKKISYIIAGCCAMGTLTTLAMEQNTDVVAALNAQTKAIIAQTTEMKRGNDINAERLQIEKHAFLLTVMQLGGQDEINYFNKKFENHQDHNLSTDYDMDNKLIFFTNKMLAKE